MTRTDDSSKSNNDRYTFCNEQKATILVSVHTNSTSDPIMDGHAHQHADPHANSHQYAHRHSAANSHPHSYAHPYADPDWHTNGDSNWHGHLDGHCHTYGYWDSTYRRYHR